MTKMCNVKEQNVTPQNLKKNKESLLSPGFRSVVAMAGWDEETLLLASLVVEDTPDRHNKCKKRFKTPPTATSRREEETLLSYTSLVVEDAPDRSTKYKKRLKSPLSISLRKRRSQRKSPVSIAVPILDLDEAVKRPREENGQNVDEVKANEEKKVKEMVQDNKKPEQGASATCSSSSVTSIAVPVSDLDEAVKRSTEDILGKEQKMDKVKAIEEKKVEEVQEIKRPEEGVSVSCSKSSFPCIDRLREELSCAICLEICFEPTTTPCGHSFCKKCLKSAADKCGKKCPKCRQLISNGRSCTVNTVLWNTIQLLFPQEVETRKESAKSKNIVEVGDKTPARRSYYNARNRSIEALNSPENEVASIRIPRISRRENARLNSSESEIASIRISRISRRENARLIPMRGGGGVSLVANQDEDAALALRLQREEFMGVSRGSENELQQLLNRRSRSFNSARANLRAIASRAINNQTRGRPT